MDRTTLFGPLTEHTVEWDQPMTPAEIIDRAGTVSSISSLPKAEREHVLDRFRELAATHPDVRGHETVTMPYVTKVYLLERR